MDDVPLSSPQMSTLGQRLYRLSLVHPERDVLTDPNGVPVKWLLDSRIPMLDGAIAQAVGHLLAERLRARGIRQVAGFGLGAYPVVCATLSAPGKPEMCGGFVREGRKGYGRRRIVEGPITKTEPVMMLDDILNSGDSALRALRLLQGEGFRVHGILTLFEYTWSKGRSRLEAQGLHVDALLGLNLRQGRQEIPNTA